MRRRTRRLRLRFERVPAPEMETRRWRAGCNVQHTHTTHTHKHTHTHTHKHTSPTVAEPRERATYQHDKAATSFSMRRSLLKVTRRLRPESPRLHAIFCVAPLPTDIWLTGYYSQILKMGGGGGITLGGPFPHFQILARIRKLLSFLAGKISPSIWLLGNV